MKKWTDYLPAQKKRATLCKIMRAAYISARSRHERINGHGAFYSVSRDLECRTPSPYEVFIEKAMSHGFNPIQVMQAEIYRVCDTCQVSSIPWLTKLAWGNKHDPMWLQRGYEAKCEAFLQASAERVRICKTIMDEFDMGDSTVAALISESDEIDPVYYVTKMAVEGETSDGRTKRMACVRYASCSNVYDAWLSSEGLTKPSYLVSFSEW